MRYVVGSSSWWDHEVKEYYPCLEKYDIQEESIDVKHRQWTLDENYKRIETDPKIKKHTYYTIEIGSQEELHQLINDVESPLIFFDSANLYGKELDMPMIEIYDGYRE